MSQRYILFFNLTTGLGLDSYTS